MTLEELLARWDERDDHYSRRRLKGGVSHPLSSDEVSAIRTFRRFEVDLLPPADRAAGFRRWATWVPGPLRRPR